jgi:hypothetical protein
MKIPGGFDALFRQLTPLFLLAVILAALLEPWVPGGAFLRATFGETFILRACLVGLGLYTLLLWGESLRLHGMLTSVLAAFREFRDGQPRGSGSGGRHPQARLEAARLLIAALGSPDPKIQATSHHNLVRLAGRDLGKDAAAWSRWLAEQEAHADS